MLWFVYALSREWHYYKVWPYRSRCVTVGMGFKSLILQGSIQADMVQEKLRVLHLHLKAVSGRLTSRMRLLKPMPTVTHLLL